MARRPKIRNHLDFQLKLGAHDDGIHESSYRFEDSGRIQKNGDC